MTKKDLFICPKCGANLLEVGITEVLVGAVVETDIHFVEKDKTKEATFGTTNTIDFDEQWVQCLACNADLHDRTAIEIIDAYENNLPHIMEDEEEQGTGQDREGYSDNQDRSNYTESDKK